MTSDCIAGQMSIFDCFDFSATDETDDERFEYALLRGACVAGAYESIMEIVTGDGSRTEKANGIKAVYGVGGFSNRKDGYKYFWVEYTGAAYCVKTKRIDADWKVQEYSWDQVLDGITRLVALGRYTDD